MKLNRQDHAGVARQAAEWYIILQEGGAKEQATFAEWIVQSPLHVQEFLNISAVHRLFDKVDAGRAIDVEALLRAPGSTVTALDGVVAFEHPAPITTPMVRTKNKPALLRRRSFVGIAASIVVTVAAGLLLSPAPWNGWHRYATAVGEQRAIELTDGSSVQLSAQSQLQVRFSDSGRDIRLVNGEALFTVRHDARLPFRVHAGNAVIQAIGTQFNVNRRTRDTAVAVIEGVVQVTDSAQPPERLKAGESAHVTHKGEIVGRSRIDAARVAAWRERRLVFQADTLEDMAQQFNRYNKAPKIRIEGEDIAQRRFTGVLDAVNPEALLNLLLEADDLIAVREGGELVIRKVDRNRQ